jgi:hypothetical protein
MLILFLTYLRDIFSCASLLGIVYLLDFYFESFLILKFCFHEWCKSEEFWFFSICHLLISEDFPLILKTRALCMYIMSLKLVTHLLLHSSLLYVNQSCCLKGCWVWQYGLWSFQTGATKLERFLSKNQHT